MFQETNNMKKNILWQCQTSCEIASRAMRYSSDHIVPPGVDGEGNANAIEDIQKYLFLQVWMVKDVQKPSKLKLHRSTTWNLLQLSRFPYC